MNQMNKLLWAGIATSLLSGPALAATVNCAVTPKNSVIADGQTLQLGALCTGGSLDSISLLMDGTSVSDNVSLAGHQAGETVYFTAPIGLGANGANEFVFSVVGVPSSGNTWGSSTEAKVVVKSSGSAIAAAQGIASPTTPVDATCGTANNQTVPSLPSNGALCASGSKPALVVSGPASYSWSCLSVTGGAEANCYATRGVTYTVTATDNGSPHGSVDPASQQVAGGSYATVTAIPNDGYNTSWTSTCGSPQSGNTYTTSAVNANCTVTASFSTAPVAVNGVCGSSHGGTFSTAPAANLCSAGTQSSVTTNTSSYTWSCSGSNGGLTAPCSATRTITGGGGTGSDPGVGSGLWVPSGMDTRTVADISGPVGTVVSYVPGCLNGESSNNSATGCAGRSSFTGTLAATGASHTFSFGSGKQLVLRYQPNAGAGSSLKYIRLRGATGGNVGTSVRVWLSTSPTATYDSVASACKQTSTQNPMVVTGPGYCSISSSNPVYYFGIEYDSATALRFQVDQSGSDFY